MTELKKPAYFCRRARVLVMIIALLVAGPVWAATNVSVLVDTSALGPRIPDDFIGLSVETGSLPPDTHGLTGYFLDARNVRLVHLFRELGIKNLRVGGGSVDTARAAPSRESIDRLFAFAEAADLKVVYSFKLPNGNPDAAAREAGYIWSHYRGRLDAFSIGNESDWHSFHIKDPLIHEAEPGRPGSAFPSYLKRWETFAARIAVAAPGAKFGGPNTGSNFPVEKSTDTTFEGMTWTALFARAVKSRPDIAGIYFHNYVGQDAKGRTPPEMIDMMLSSRWDSVEYPALYAVSGAVALADGLGYRLMESNSFSGEVEGGSDCFATALFALDYLHWWAQERCEGVNFHNRQWIANNTIRLLPSGELRVNPMGYGMKAFDLGSHGNVLRVDLGNPDGLNITTYAVGNGRKVWITLINKEHGDHERDASVKVIFDAAREPVARLMRLQAPGGAAAVDGTALGGASLTEDTTWRGRWEEVTAGAFLNHNGCEVQVPAASAVILEVNLQSR